MIRFDIGELVKPGTEIVLPPISERLMTVRRYSIELRKVVSGIRAEVNRSVIPAYRAERSMMRDADESTFSSVESIAAELNRRAELMMMGILSSEADRHTDVWIETARKQIGVDLRAVVQRDDLGNLLRNAAGNNAALIKSLSADAIKDVKRIVYEAGIAGDAVAKLRARLLDRYNVAYNRADLIATDQSAKFVADLNQARQQQAGIEEYDWMTSNDERVRPRHRALDGKRYKWGEPTGAENGASPGKPIRCRCVARGVVKWKRAKPTNSPRAAAALLPPAPRVRRPRTPRAPTLPGIVPVDRKALDFETKSYVLAEGRAAGVEFLSGYDEITGERTDNASGNVRSVGLTAVMVQMMTTATRRMVMHHNHPSSGSFSRADYVTTHRNAGMAELWAHGHNGSTYKMRRKTMGVAYDPAGREAIFDDLANRLNTESSVLLRAGRLEFDAFVKGAWPYVSNHIIMLVMRERGLIEYEFDLKQKTKRVVAEYQWFIDEMVAKLK